jgi:Tol biopolymer transport system component
MDTTDSDNDGNGDNQTNLTNSAAGDYDPAFSPDGQKIAFMSVVGPAGTPAEIYVMDTDPATNDATNLTNNPAEDYTPNWSPNGNKIAFSSEFRDINDPNNIDIYVMNADGSGQKRLTRKAASDFDPAFSPDGKKIAFTRSANGGDNEIYVMKARPEGKRNRPKNLTNNNWGDGFADWQPVP